MIVLQIIGYALLSLLGLGAIAVAVSLLTWIAQKVEELVKKSAGDWLELKNQAKQNELKAVRVLKPDENGRNGVFFDGAVFRNTDSSEVFSMQITESLDTFRYQLDAIQRTLLSMKGISIQPQGAIAELMSGDVGLQGLPEYISLEDAMRKHNIKPSINNVYLGESLDGPVMADFETCTHILLSSGSGWEKARNWRA